jgi:hypothetical protein
MTAPPRLAFLAVNASYSHTSLAAWRLRESAEAAGWEWHGFEATARSPVQPLLAAIGNIRPRVLAAGFYLFNRTWLIGFLRRFKALHPDCAILGGGPEFLGDNRLFFNAAPGVDAVVRGEGELAFADFLRQVEHPENWPAIPGLCGVAGGRAFDAGTARPPHLADLPSPYARNLAGFTKPFLLMETARGCFNRCGFCTSAGTGPLRTLPLEQVRTELQTAADAGVREVRMADRTFNEQPERCLQLLRLFRTEFPGMRFHLEIEPALLTPPLFDELALARPGQLHLEAGVQCLNPQVLEAVGRRVSADRARANLAALCRLSNLAVHADLLAGLPGQTLADLEHDLAILSGLGPAEIQLERLKLLPGTRLAAERDRFRLAAAPEPPYEVLRTPDMSEQDLARAERLALLADGLYNTPELHPIFRRAAARMPGLWTELTEAPDLPSDMPETGWSLEARYRFLFTRLAGHPDLQHDLAYAWLKHGFSAPRGLVPARPWKAAVPAEAILLEGEASRPAARLWLAQTDPPLLFAYGRGPDRSAQAIYRLPQAECSRIEARPT